MNRFTHPYKFKTYELPVKHHTRVGNINPYMIGTDEWISLGKAMQDHLQRIWYNN